MNKPSKTQMSEPKKDKEPKEKQTDGVMVGGRRSVGGGDQTAWGWERSAGWWAAALVVMDGGIGGGYTAWLLSGAAWVGEGEGKALGERERGKMKIKMKTTLFSFWFWIFFYLFIYLFFNRLVNPGWVNQPKCGKKSDWLLLRSITQN
jgi:hypothetical protein